MLESVLNFALDLLQFASPFIIGLVAVPIFDKLKSVISWLDSRPAQLKQVLVVVLTAGLTLLAQVFAGMGVAFNVPLDLLVWDQSALSAFLSAVIAFAVKAGKQAANKPEDPVVTGS